MSKRIIDIVFSIFLGLLNLGAVLVIGWASYRGLELSDESFYYLGYRYFDNNPDLAAASFHFVYGRFFSTFDLTLTGVRLLRLVLTILASVVLFMGIVKLKNPSSLWKRLILLNIILGGMLLSYTWTPMALSYNSMSSILITFVIGFWLLSLRSTAWEKSICWAILGGLFVLLFFIKATNLILFPLVILATLYWRYTQGLHKEQIFHFNVSSAFAFTLGIVGMLSFISGGIGSIPETVDTHLQQLFGLAKADSSHSFSYLWKKYYENAELVVQKLMYPVLGLFVFYILVKVNSKTKKGSVLSWSVNLFKVLSILVLLAFVIYNECWRGGIQHRYDMLIPYILIFVVVLLNQSVESKKIDFIILLGLFSIPIAGSIGTNNGLSAQVLFYGVFVFLLVYNTLHSSSTPWFKHLILALIMLLATSQVISGTLLNPYRLSPLAQNNQKLDGIPALKNLKVDSAVFELSENLKSLRSLEAEYIFTYSGMLGVNSLAGKKPYSLEWFNEGEDDKICTIINKSKIDPENILFLIPEEIPLTEKITSCLEEKGVYFKTEYSKIKTFKFFYPRNNKKITLNVYHYTPN